MVASSGWQVCVEVIVSASLNKVMILGNLGRDPELRTTEGGQSVATLNVATTDTWVDKSGNKQERTEWHRVVVWGRQGENAAKYLKKGRSVYVEGRIQTREYTDKDGNSREIVEIVADNVNALDRPREDAEPRQESKAKARPPQGEEYDPFADED